MSGTAKNNAKYNNFAIISLGWLGDTLLSQGLCKNIKKYNPDSKIIFICRNDLAEIGELIPEADSIIPFDKNLKLCYIEFAKSFKSKCSDKIDVAIVVHPHERSIICAKCIGAKTVVSLPFEEKFNLLNFFINKKRKYIENEIRNEYKNFYNAKYINELGIDSVNYDLELKIPDDRRIDLSKFNLPEKYIVLAPSSKADIKDWDYENISEFIKNSQFPVVLTGTEKTMSVGEKLTKDGINFINLCNKTTILDLALIIKNAFAAVSVDTGTMHLAYGLGVETVCLFFDKKMVNEWLQPERKNVHLLLGEKLKIGDEISTQQNISYKQVTEIIKIIGDKNEKI